MGEKEKKAARDQAVREDFIRNCLKEKDEQMEAMEDDRGSLIGNFSEVLVNLMVQELEEGDSDFLEQEEDYAGSLWIL